MGSVALAQPRLLLVEDDAAILSTLQEMFDEGGYHITPAMSLPASLEKLSEQMFHLVLTDLFHSSGQDPLQSIQPLLVEAAPIPVGVMTAWQVPVEAVTQAGAAFLLRKPFDLDELARAVQRELAPRPAMSQRELVEQFFAVLNARDWKRLALICTPDLAVVSLSAPPVAAAGARRGLLSLRPLLERRFLAFPGYTIEEVRVFARPLGMAARYIARWQSRDGVEHRVTGSVRFLFRGERISQIEGAF